MTDKDILLKVKAELEKLAAMVQNDTDYPHEILINLLADAAEEAGNRAAFEAEHGAG